MKLSLVLMLFSVEMCFSDHLSVRMREWSNKFNHAESNEEITSDETALPVLVFTDDWQESVEGELGVGREFKIDYAGSRLPGRPTMYGQPSWAIEAKFKFSDDDEVHSEELDGGQDAQVLTKTIFMPYEAKKLIIWFQYWSYHGGYKYDSNNGNNYHFAITKPSIVFDSSWGETVHGNLEAGGKFDVYYDYSRLGGSEMYVQTKFSEEGNISHKRLTSISLATSYLYDVDDIPDDADIVIMWFYRVVNGMPKYDSNNDQNYRFNLA